MVVQKQSKTEIKDFLKCKKKVVSAIDDVKLDMIERRVASTMIYGSGL